MHEIAQFGRRHPVLFSAAFCAVIGPILGCILMYLASKPWGEALSNAFNPLVWIIAIEIAGPFGFVAGAIGGLIIPGLRAKLSAWKLLALTGALGAFLGGLYPMEFVVLDAQWDRGYWLFSAFGAIVGILCAAFLSRLLYGLPRIARSGAAESHP